MIESGTHTLGISAMDFGLPPNTALRYDRPADALSRFFSSYAVLDSDPAVFSSMVSWVLPGWAMIWIGLAEQTIGATIGSRHYNALGSASVLGVTSRAMPFVVSGGTSVAVQVSPLGWARFFAPSAELMRDRLVPLDDLLHNGSGAALHAVIAASDRGPAVKDILDRFFLERLPLAHPDEPLIEQIAQLVKGQSTRDLEASAAGVGVSAQAMLRLTKRHFGFPPKILAMRARFLRAICDLILTGQQPGPAVIPPGYYDASHFTRDGMRFLGMTPRRFLALDLRYLRANLRAQSLVFAASKTSLHERGGNGSLKSAA